MSGMYFLQLDGITYERKGGGGWTLPDALREIRGVRNARIVREDGTVAVDLAGSDTEVVHVTPEGRTRRVRRRLTLAAGRAWETEMREHMAARGFPVSA